MAKKTINDLRKSLSEMDKEKAEIRKEITGIHNLVEAKKAEAEDALNSGDEAKYLSCQDELKVLEARELIRQRKLESASKPFTDNEVKAAWDDYATDFNKQMEKRLKEYRTAVETMEKAYIDLVNFQNEALKTRKICGDMMGVECPEYSRQTDDIYYTKMKKLVTIPNEPINKIIDTGNGIISVKMPDDCEYYLAHRLISPEMIGSVVRMHKPVF